MGRRGSAPIGIVFFFLVVLTASEMMAITNAKDCYIKSNKYWGLCFPDHCEEVCKGEKFDGGKCTKLWQCDCVDYDC